VAWESRLRSRGCRSCPGAQRVAILKVTSIHKNALKRSRRSGSLVQFPPAHSAARCAGCPAPMQSCQYLNRGSMPSWELDRLVTSELDFPLAETRKSGAIGGNAMRPMARIRRSAVRARRSKCTAPGGLGRLVDRSFGSSQVSYWGSISSRRVEIFAYLSTLPDRR
jgi:hypothetical protein